MRVVATLPFDGAEEIPPDTQVTVRFSHPVPPRAVAPYFQVLDTRTEQPVAGELRWQDAEGERGYRTLVFEPADRLRPASAYRIRLNAPASEGVAPFEATFVTMPPLAVEAVQPSPGAEGVSVRPTDTLITVQFNHPVVPLVGPAQQAQLPVPIRVAPPLQGEGEWLTTRLFVFRPTEFLRPGTEYQVTVRAGLTDTLGLPLDSPYTWRFTTALPAVEAVEPANADDLIGATAPITVVFNVPMDPSSTAQRFRVTLDSPDGPAVDGSIEWPDARHLRFRPAAPLPRGRRVVIAVSAGAQGLAGGELAQCVSRHPRRGTGPARRAHAADCR
ncbi:MAG: Ig-like domain-containing protein [Ardenticatenia bacterium]|nr:Ig-like domain-containing protein [Ardenticatenia bacterium]